MPGCSRKTAEFCQQNNGGKKLKTQRPKYPRSRRRYERKRNNRKKSGKTQKQKRKERRKRKRKERRRRQRQLRKQRNKQNIQKQSRVYKMGDYALNMDKQRENRRIQWSSSSQKSSKIPPFEALLSSTSSNSAGSSVYNKQNSEENNNNNQNTEEEYEDLSDPSSYFDEISSSDFQTKSGNSGSRRNGRKRTPLPLKEARDDLPDQNGDQRGWKRRKRK